MVFLQQGIEPEGFPLLVQSLKTDSPVKDMNSNPNKKLYGGNVISRSAISALCTHHYLHTLS